MDWQKIIETLVYAFAIFGTITGSLMAYFKYMQTKNDSYHSSIKKVEDMNKRIKEVETQLQELNVKSTEIEYIKDVLNDIKKKADKSDERIDKMSDIILDYFQSTNSS